MTDKKHPDFLKIIEGCGSIHDQVAQLDKWYEAEKQRADRLEKELSEYTTISYMLGAEDYKDKVKALKAENKKLKEALYLIENGYWETIEGIQKVAKEALK